MSIRSFAAGERGARWVSGLAMAGAGLVGLWIGGPLFATLCAVVAGAIFWEIARIAAPGISNRRAAVAALAASATVAWAALLPFPLLLFAVIPAILSLLLPRGRASFAMFGTAVLLAAASLAGIRIAEGFGVAAWIILIVVATDVAGYFCGRLLGGPRILPAVSPGKRWSGAAGGWCAAAAIAAIFHAQFGIGHIWAGIALSVAAQLGDLAESWLKRRACVKDSSRMIPGHGGVFDRFDGFVGACICHWLLTMWPGLPSG